jgi:PAS domain S-box-containing protein
MDCNAAACLLSGYQREELIGHSVDIVNATAGTQAERIDYLNRLRETNHLKYETSHRHKNGTVFPVEVSTTIIKIGERELLIGIDRDITERKNIETKLSESEERYRRLSDATVEGVVVHDKGILLDSNDTFAKMFGYELSEVIGMAATEFLTPETRDLTVQNIRSGYEKPYEVMV